MTIEQFTKSYDLNIMKEEGFGWIIEIYEFVLEVDKNNLTNYQESSYARKKDNGIIRLTEEEAKGLSLGSSNGYSDADYFWVDTDDFFEFYKDIPQRVLDILSNLPEYKMELVYV